MMSVPVTASGAKASAPISSANSSVSAAPPITTFTDLEDGLAKANATEFGLAGYVFTENTKTAFLAAEGLEVGMVGVNNLVIAAAEIPFGGIKASGFGREGGTEGIEHYTVTKYVNILL